MFNRLKGSIVLRTLAAGFAVAVATSATAADIAGLLARADKASAGGDSSAAIEALEQALERVRTEAPLVIVNSTVVSRPAQYFGDYEPRANAVFSKGQTLNFYAEPKNLVSRVGAKYEPAFEVDMEVLSADGKAVAKQPRFVSFRLPTKSPVQDIFLNLDVKLTGAPSGRYTIRFVVRDLNSKKTAATSYNVELR